MGRARLDRRADATDRWAAVHLYELFIGPSPVAQYNLFANALTVAIPMVVAYAVVKHRVLDIGVVVRRG